MNRGNASAILVNRPAGKALLVVLILCMICSWTPARAGGHPPGSKNPAQTAMIVYLHPVSTDVVVLVDELPVFKTDSVFGVWCYQVNLTSFLDTTPGTVEIKTRLKNHQFSYCDIEVRQIDGDNGKTTILAEKTIRIADRDALNKKSTEYLTALTLDLALPVGSVRPVWVEPDAVDLKPVTRDTSAGLVKEIFTAIQKCDVKSVMTLIEPALTNQAMMEGIPPVLFKRAMRQKLMRYCIPDIPIAETMEDFYRRGYSNRMAPLNFDKMHYSFIKDSSREDQKGNVFLPDEPIRFSIKNNNDFVARVFLSGTSEKRDKIFVSRFLFDRTE